MINKIVFFCSDPLNDSALFFRAGVTALELIKQGFEVKVYSADFDFNHKRTINLWGLPVTMIGQAHYLASQPFSTRKKLSTFKHLKENLKTWARFKKELEDISPPFVHVFTSLPLSLLIAYLCQKSGYKTALDLVDLSSAQAKWSNYSSPVAWLAKFFEEKIPRLFPKITVCSHYLASKFPNAVLIPNMVDLDQFKKKYDLGLKKKYHLKKNVVVFEGRVGLYHGQTEILPEIKKINQRLLVETSFVFIGGGEKFDQLKDQVNQLGLKDSIILTGHLDQKEVARLLGVADIGLLPMWSSPLYQARNPLKLFEYLSSQVVVVSNRVGDVAKIIKHRQNGWLGRPGNLSDLRKAIEYLLSNPKEREKLAENGLKTAKKFSKEKIIKKWINFYESSLSLS